MHRGIVFLSLAALLAGFAPQAWSDGLVANWKFSETAGSSSFADSGPNGLTATLYGTDTLTTIQGPFGASRAHGVVFQRRGRQPGQQRRRRQRQQHQ